MKRYHVSCIHTSLPVRLPPCQSPQPVWASWDHGLIMAIPGENLRSGEQVVQTPGPSRMQGKNQDATITDLRSSPLPVLLQRTHWKLQKSPAPAHPDCYNQMSFLLRVNLWRQGSNTPAVLGGLNLCARRMIYAPIKPNKT